MTEFFGDDFVVPTFTFADVEPGAGQRWSTWPSIIPTQRGPRPWPDWVVTSGVDGNGPLFVLAAVSAARAFDAFVEDNDPRGEHDFGSYEIAGVGLFWKIDYYDEDLRYGSPDPADPLVTRRIITIMLASEY